MHDDEHEPPPGSKSEADPAHARRSVLGAGEAGAAGASPARLRWLLVVVPLLVIVGLGSWLAARWADRLARDAGDLATAQARHPVRPRHDAGETRLPPFVLLQDRELDARLPGPAVPSAASDAPPQAAGPRPARQEPDAALAFSADRVVALLASADAEAGARQFRICTVCHTARYGEPPRIGPNLWNIVGGRTAAAPAFAYSQPLLARGGTWTYAALASYLHNPRGDMPGTKMAFAGIKDEQRLADLIAHLRTLADKPVPLPGHR
jgi:cytochrome c